MVREEVRGVVEGAGWRDYGEREIEVGGMGRRAV